VTFWLTPNLFYYVSKLSNISIFKTNQPEYHYIIKKIVYQMRNNSVVFNIYNWKSSRCYSCKCSCCYKWNCSSCIKRSRFYEATHIVPLMVKQMREREREMVFHQDFLTFKRTIKFLFKNSRSRFTLLWEMLSQMKKMRETENYNVCERERERIREREIELSWM